MYVHPCFVYMVDALAMSGLSKVTCLAVVSKHNVFCSPWGAQSARLDTTRGTRDQGAQGWVFHYQKHTIIGCGIVVYMYVVIS